MIRPGAAAAAFSMLAALPALAGDKPPAADKPAAKGDEPAQAPLGPLLHPDGPGRLRWRAGVGALFDVLPRRVVESEQRTVAQITASFRLGLPLGFSTDIRAAAIYVSNQVELGAAWGYRIKSFSFGVQDHGGIWFGAFGFTGFDASGWSVINEPGLSIGLDVLGSRFSLTSEALLAFARHTTLGDASKTVGKGAPFAGIATTLVVESFFLKTSEIYYGVGLLWAQPQYEAWIAFSDLRARVWYPRVLAGYAF